FIAGTINTMAKKGETVAIDTAGRRFAVIVDEAHSSSAGETAQALRGILNKEGIEAAVAAQILDDEDDSDLSPEARESMLRDMAKRPRQPNLSYFAFTATPKFKTKAIFDEPGDDAARPSTSTACARPSRKDSSWTCWRTTPPTRPILVW